MAAHGRSLVQSLSHSLLVMYHLWYCECVFDSWIASFCVRVCECASVFVCLCLCASVCSTLLNGHKVVCLQLPVSHCFALSGVCYCASWALGLFVCICVIPCLRPRCNDNNICNCNCNKNSDSNCDASNASASLSSIRLVRSTSAFYFLVLFRAKLLLLTRPLLHSLWL